MMAMTMIYLMDIRLPDLVILTVRLPDAVIRRVLTRRGAVGGIGGFDSRCPDSLELEVTHEEVLEGIHRYVKIF